MTRTLYYRVGGHPLSITFVDEGNDEQLIPSFRRFRLEEAPAEPLLFQLTVDDSFPWERSDHEVGQFDSGGNNYGVYRSADGSYQFEVTDVYGVLCSLVSAVADFSRVTVVLRGQTEAQRAFGLNNALMLTYAFAAADRMTLLMHASVIRCDGRGYLMTAPSGTGKSTHTRLWYDNIPGCDLMNDDNPVVRIIDGQPYIFGSPWSGKTPCYRNVKAKLGAVTRIDRAPENSVDKLAPIEAFASFLPSCSSMKWDKEIFNYVCDTVTRVVETTGIYILHCRPDREAAEVCHAAIAVKE